MHHSDTAADGSRKHMRLRSELADQISQGAFRPGQFLPSEPELARRFALSRSTVRQALASLEGDGLVERLPGKGTVVTGAPQTNTQLAAFALVLPEIQSGHYPALVDGFAAAAAELHYQILVCTTGNDVRRQGDIILQLLDKRVAGVALLPPTVGETPDYQLRQLQSQGIPIVMLHRSIDSVAAPMIAMPYEEVATLAADRLIEMGHRNIAYIASHRNPGSLRYEQALRLAIRKAGGSLPSELVYYGTSAVAVPDDEWFREIEVVIRQMLSLPSAQRPTAIFDPWDSHTEAIYFLLTRLGIQVPDEISLVSFGGAKRGNTLAQRLAAVTIDEALTAATTVKLLDEMSRGARPINDDARFTVPLSFYNGESMAPPAVGESLSAN